jgi:hypothetical protein
MVLYFCSEKKIIMKKILFLLALLPTSLFSQTTNLLISEYGEGTPGSKKYIEIYNGTGATVNLANYQIWKNSNGTAWNFSSSGATLPLTLTGTLANGATYVIANNNVDVLNANLYTTFILFNGDDATGLAWNGGSGTTFTLIDAFGEQLIDPGTGWAVAGVVNATVDKILTRKTTVCSPNTNWTLSRGTTTLDSEWEIAVTVYNLTSQTAPFLGLHTTTCAASCNTSASISPSACVTYTVPSGDEIYTTSGTYFDTLANAAGCDSVLTINLTIYPVYTGITDAETICSGQSYTFGTQNLTAAGVYTNTFTSVGGCDSTVTLTLSIVASYTTPVSATICAGQSYILGTQVLTANGLFTQLFTTSAGCDSTVNLTLTVLPNAASTVTISACDSLVSPTGNYTWTTSGIYTDTLVSSNLCDSVITFNLTVGTSELLIFTEVACDSFTFEGNTYSATGTYDVIFTNASNCDSIRRLVLTVNETPALPITSGNQVICGAGLPTDLTVEEISSDVALIIAGIADGPLPGGLPKVIEFYAIEAIADLSVYGFGSASNGGGTDGVEYTFPAVALAAGQHYYVSTDSAAFNVFFGFAANAIEPLASNNNGDDAVELFLNGVVVDLFGLIDVDGTGQNWEYLDGWAYRNSGSMPNYGVFDITDWTFSGIDVFDNQTTNATTPISFPIGTFSTNAAAVSITWYADAALTAQLGTGFVYATGQTSGSEDYFVVASANGCSSDAVLISISVGTIPAVTLALSGVNCIQDPAFELSGGLPIGGTYSGAGVTAGVFDPAAAGAGTHIITYSFLDNGCEGIAEDTLFVELCGSIAELNTADYTVYPNPSNGQISIDFSSQVSGTIVCMDMNGKILATEIITDSKQKMDVSNLSNGNYILKITTDSGVSQERISIQK